jgi:long-subunit fatty acid transport protein
VQRQGYYENQEILVGTGLEYSPLPHCKINLGLRYYFNRQMTIYDKDGNNDRDYDVDNAWGGMLNLKFSF